MRLWTFQNKVAFNYIQQYGIWYSDWNYSERLRPIDEKYIQENFNTPYGSIDTMPIYCFASMGKYNHNLCIGTMFGEYNHLVGWMDFRLENMAMFELEVPEGFILSSKRHSGKFVDYPDIPKDTPKKDRWKYEKVINEDKVELHNHLDFVNKVYDDDVESLIPYISKNHIAAVRVFRPVESLTAGYSACKVETIFIGNHRPLWTVDIYCNGDGYPRVMEEGELKVGNFNTIRSLQLEYGLTCVYPYMTIKAIYDSCVEVIIEHVRSEMDKRGVNYKDVTELSYENFMKLPYLNEGGI